MDFYYGRVSGNSARAAFCLYETGIGFTHHLIDTSTRENRSARYLALNPMGKIPALIDGDVRLWESNAINWYLAEKHPAARLIPESIAGRASLQRWLFFQTAHVSPACLAVVRVASARVQEFWGIKGDPQAAEVGRKELSRFLPVLDQALSDREWLERDFSLADIAYAPHLWWLAADGFDFTATPAVRAWLDRVWARPAWQKTVDLIFSARA